MGAAGRGYKPRRAASGVETAFGLRSQGPGGHADTIRRSVPIMQDDQVR